MNAATMSVARAFLAVARITPAPEQQALVDAVMDVLRSHGLLRDAGKFPSLVRRLARQENKTVSACLTSLTGQAGPVLKQLTQSIESSLGRPCEMTERADPSLLGGFLLEIGDERLDATLRRSLTDLADRFLLPIPIPSPRTA